MTKQNPHIGSAFEDFLDEESLLEECTNTALKRVIAWQVAQAIQARGLTKAAMARQMHTSRAALDRLLDPQNTSGPCTPYNAPLQSLASEYISVWKMYGQDKNPHEGTQKAQRPETLWTIVFQREIYRITSPTAGPRRGGREHVELFCTIQRVKTLDSCTVKPYCGIYEYPQREPPRAKAFS
jgi:hypothetical protein